MAVTLNGSVNFNMQQTGTHDHGTPTLPIVKSLAMAFSSGTGSNAIDVWFSDDRSLAAASEGLDLSGSLTNAFGATVSQVEVRFLLIYNSSTTDVLSIGGAAANQAYAGLFAASNDIIKVGPGGIFLWYSPVDGSGLTIAAGTADQLKIDAGSATITYSIYIGGVSA